MLKNHFHKVNAYSVQKKKGILKVTEITYYLINKIYIFTESTFITLY